jgi:biopolymer transport protein ExbD
MGYALNKGDASPILELNTTPLIDVLLVLLVMFILTLPMQTHAVKVDLPVTPPQKTIDRVKNEVAITANGAILWNGAPVSKPELRGLLISSQALQPTPELHLRPDSAARYAVVDDVLALTKRANVQNVGFIGNEKYAEF